MVDRDNIAFFKSMFRPSGNKNAIPPLEPHSTLAQVLHHQGLSAVILLLATGLALAIANVQLGLRENTAAEWYQWLWHVDVGFHIAERNIVQSLHVWVNDGLMAIFFFLVGLEIKRELFVGELATIRKAMLPIFAALGGMAVPAAIYAAVNVGSDGMRGWGIPMATDIAFAAGIIGLLGKRIPKSLAIFLFALAIVDDLGAVAVIALFYTKSVDPLSLQAGLVCIGLSWLFARCGIRSAAAYAVLAIGTWIGFLNSGVHATVAGVLFAFTIPVDARYDTPLFIDRIRALLTRFEEAEDHVNPRMVNVRQQQIIRAMETECIHVEGPLQRIENKLYPLVAFLIMPLFAFANAGVTIELAGLGSQLTEPVALGIVLGLVAGKQIGIMLAAGIAVRLRLADLPAGVQWRHIYGVSWLAGVGFTMSLFIADLSFGYERAASDVHSVAVSNQHLLEAKMGILFASLIAAVVGTGILFWSSRGNARTLAARIPDVCEEESLASGTTEL